MASLSIRPEFVQEPNLEFPLQSADFPNVKKGDGQEPQFPQSSELWIREFELLQFKEVFLVGFLFFLVTVIPLSSEAGGW